MYIYVDIDIDVDVDVDSIDIDIDVDIVIDTHRYRQVLENSKIPKLANMEPPLQQASHS